MFDRPIDKSAPVSKCIVQRDKITVSLHSREDMDDDDDSSNDDEWIDTFCDTRNKDPSPSWFCQIPNLKDKSYFSKFQVINKFYEYPKDDPEFSNLVKQATQLITENLKQEYERISPDEEYKLQCIAEHLYGLFHAQYILTKKGMAAMCEKFKAIHWGSCPRYHCYQNPVLPYGQSDLPGRHCVQVYCPVCGEVYDSLDERAKKIDGAYFGPTFAILFCKVYPDLCTVMKPDPVYTIHGFKIADYNTDDKTKFSVRKRRNPVTNDNLKKEEKEEEFIDLVNVYKRDSFSKEDIEEEIEEEEIEEEEEEEPIDLINVYKRHSFPKEEEEEEEEEVTSSEETDQNHSTASASSYSSSSSSS